jgi:curved DNA-binding protein CbpA
MDEKKLEALKVLGLQEGASDASVKKAYRELSKIYHPDKCTESKELCNDNLTKIQKARKILLGEKSPKNEDEVLDKFEVNKSIKEMNQEIKFSGKMFEHGTLDSKYASNFPFEVKVWALAKSSISKPDMIRFEVPSTKAKVDIPGNKFTMDNLVKVLSKSGTEAPKYFNGIDYLLANEDLYEKLVDPDWHYVNYGMKEGRNPSKFFDEKTYLEINPEAKQDVDQGKFANGFTHFVEYGCKNGFSPDGIYNEKDYIDSSEELSSLGENDCAFFHCIESRIFDGLAGCAGNYAD